MVTKPKDQLSAMIIFELSNRIVQAALRAYSEHRGIEQFSGRTQRIFILITFLKHFVSIRLGWIYICNISKKLVICLQTEHKGNNETE